MLRQLTKGWWDVNICYKYTAVAPGIHKEQVQYLSCEHEEADTRIIRHLKYIDDQSSNN